MYAAVVHAPDGVPRYESFPDPTPRPGETVVRVRAAGLHPLVRAHASGKHYTSTGTYPLVPGVDGVGELPDGRLVYLTWQRAPHGTFAERATAGADALVLPAGLAPDVAAGIVNPAMSSWVALKLRARMVAGERVAILGATGAGGQLAVQVARAFGASHVLAAGRNAEVLDALGADATVRVDASLRDELTRAFSAGVDIIIDYLWGAPAEAALAAVLAARADLAGRRVRYVNIGEMAGHHVALSAHAFRSMDLEMSGSGFGSVPASAFRAEIALILERAANGELTIVLDRVPLARVAEAWASGGGKRVVFEP